MQLEGKEGMNDNRDEHVPLLKGLRYPWARQTMLDSSMVVVEGPYPSEHHLFHISVGWVAYVLRVTIASLKCVVARR